MDDHADVGPSRSYISKTTRTCGIEVRFLLMYFGTRLPRFVRDLRVGGNDENTGHSPRT
jgi:hypothetical protein